MKNIKKTKKYEEYKKDKKKKRTIQIKLELGVKDVTGMNLYEEKKD